MSSDSRSSLDSLKRRLKTDETWKNFRAIVEQSWTAEFDNFIDEMLRLHKTREVRMLNGNSGSKKLSNAALQDQAFRSRCVEIVITVLRNKNRLDIAISNTFKYIEATYVTLLQRKGCKTKADQRAIIEACFKSPRETQEQMETLMEVGDRVIEDLDKAGYALKNALEALQITTKREYAS